MVPTFAFSVPRWRHANKRTKKMWKEHCNHSQWGKPGRDTGWRAYPQGTDGGEGIRLLGTTRRQEGWDHCFRASFSQEDTEELTLRQVLRNETGTVKLRRVWVWRVKPSGQRPLERKNLVLGVWVEGAWGRQPAVLFTKFHKVYVLTLLPAAKYPTIPARTLLSDCHNCYSSWLWWQEPRGEEEHGDTPEKSQVRTEQPPELNLWISF